MATHVDWQQETRRYDRPHPRLVLMAGLLRELPQRRLLDVGCSTGALRDLLPPEFEYFGCDIADHARATLGAERFQQLDFNRDQDLSAFVPQRIDAVHIGGVLEYLERPERLLASVRELVPAGGALVLSIINFEAQRYQTSAAHHAGWIYKPSLDECRDLLQGQRFAILRQLAFVGKPGVRGWWRTRRANARGVDDRWTRRHAQQFVIVARAAA